MINASYYANPVRTIWCSEKEAKTMLNTLPENLRRAIEEEGLNVLKFVFVDELCNKYSPLDYAITIQDRESVNKLLSMGPKAMKSRRDFSVFQFYFRNLGEEFESDIEIFQMLLDHVPDLNSQDPIGKTPLHTALLYMSESKCFHWDLIELLFKRGAASCKDLHGKTPFECLKFSSALYFFQKRNQSDEERHFDRLASYLCLEKKYHPNSDSGLTSAEFSAMATHRCTENFEMYQEWFEVLVEGKLEYLKKN